MSTIDEVLNAEARFMPLILNRYKVKYEDVFSWERGWRLTHPRHALFWLISEKTGANPCRMAQALGFDRSTITKALKSMERKLAKDKALADFIKLTQSSVQGGYILDSAGVPAA